MLKFDGSLLPIIKCKTAARWRCVCQSSTALMAAADARSVAGANKLAINPNTAAGSSDAGGAASKRADSVFGNFSYSKETDGADPAARAAGLAAELDRSASMK